MPFTFPPVPIFRWSIFAVNPTCEWFAGEECERFAHDIEEHLNEIRKGQKPWITSNANGIGLKSTCMS